MHGWGLWSRLRGQMGRLWSGAPSSVDGAKLRVDGQRGGVAACNGWACSVQRGGSLDNGNAVPALSQFEGKAKTDRPSADHQYIVGLFKVDHRGHASPGLCRH